MFWERWGILGCSPSVINIIREGFRLDFRNRPLLSRSACLDSGSPDPSRSQTLSTIVQDLLEKHAIEPV